MKKKINTKPRKKVIIADMEPVRPFKLQDQSPEEQSRILLALQSLKMNAGWLFLSQVFKENIQVLESQILEKRGEKNEILDENKVDELRFKRLYLKELLDKPDFWIKQIRKDVPEIENLDPYFDK